jgi:DNA-directed RNA polymerase specialized sigma24 family protein
MKRKEWQSEQDLKQSSLINGMIKRDEKLQVEAYNKYSPAIYGVIRQSIPNEQKSSDLLLKVFIRIFNEIDTYNAKRQIFFMWMYKIAIVEISKASKTPDTDVLYD